MSLPVIEADRLTLRPLTADDADTLAAILQEPSVAPWWGRWDADRVRREVEGWAIVIDGAVQGWLQAYEEQEPEYRHVAFDITLSTAFQDQGYGPAAIRAAIGHFIAQGHHRFTIDPSATNARAIRAYEKIGFRPVGIMRQYERAPDGSWRDGLLMDLLAAELPAP
jgi:aminoglycoside 6'-N-acetyltransferase